LQAKSWLPAKRKRNNQFRQQYKAAEISGFFFAM
jgi:hypothetical protein